MFARVECWSQDHATHIIALHCAELSRFHAGQYLNIVHPAGQRIPFSIASAPEQLPLVELHYKPTPAHPHTRLMAELAATERLQIEAPLGNVSVDALAANGLVCVAQQTGISQVASISRHLHARASERKQRIIWADPEADFYLAKELGHTELLMVAKADVCEILQELPLTNEDIVVCGAPNWVYRHTDVLLARGVDTAQIQSDVFSYAPRT